MMCFQRAKIFCQCAFLLVSLALTPEHSLAEFNPQLAVMNCKTCHRVENINISMTHHTQLYKTLLAFKYDQRPALLMNRISKGFSDEELKQIALTFTLRDAQ